MCTALDDKHLNITKYVLRIDLLSFIWKGPNKSIPKKENVGVSETQSDGNIQSFSERQLYHAIFYYQHNTIKPS